MKGFAIGILVIFALIGGVAYYYFSPSASTPAQFKSGDEKLTGILRSVPNNNEYQYVILAEGKTTGVTSSTLDLSKFTGKKIEITGQYSGTTMYADSVVEVSD